MREVSESLGFSTRHLGRLFRERVGTTPKRFGRIRRLQRLLAAAYGRPAPDWAFAAEHGCFDQPA